MIPDVGQMLRGFRKTLTEVVIPGLEDPFAVEQAKVIVGALAHLETVEEAVYPYEWREAADYGAFLESFARGFRDRASSAGDLALAREIDEELAVLATPGDLPSLRRLREANLRRKALVCRIVAEVLDARQDETWAADARRDLDRLLRAQVARERAWIKHAGVDAEAEGIQDLDSCLFGKEKAGAESTR